MGATEQREQFSLTTDNVSKAYADIPRPSVVNCWTDREINSQSKTELKKTNEVKQSELHIVLPLCSMKTSPPFQRKLLV